MRFVEEYAPARVAEASSHDNFLAYHRTGGVNLGTGVLLVPRVIAVDGV